MPKQDKIGTPWTSIQDKVVATRKEAIPPEEAKAIVKGPPPGSGKLPGEGLLPGEGVLPEEGVSPEEGVPPDQGKPREEGKLPGETGQVARGTPGQMDPWADNPWAPGEGDGWDDEWAPPPPPEGVDDDDDFHMHHPNFMGSDAEIEEALGNDDPTEVAPGDAEED